MRRPVITQKRRAIHQDRRGKNESNDNNNKYVYSLHVPKCAVTPYYREKSKVDQHGDLYIWYVWFDWDYNCKAEEVEGAKNVAFGGRRLMQTR